mgnify:CR=1 FL=1
MMFPNFSESHIYDGDLVDIKQQDMHAAWGRTITKDADISPQRMGLNALNKLKSGGMVGLNALRRGYKDTVVDASGKEKDATKPDSYAPARGPFAAHAARKTCLLYTSPSTRHQRGSGRPG